MQESEMPLRRVSLLATALLSGCASYSPSIPQNYVGPTAKLDDSAHIYSNTKADFFVADAVNGASIDNSLNETFRRNQGSGMSMTPYFISRNLIAGQPVAVSVKGRTHYAAPILELTSAVYQVKGIVKFTPEARHEYAVKGELRQDHSAVWIEDVASHKVVGKKIEVNGSAKLGFFEK